MSVLQLSLKGSWGRRFVAMRGASCLLIGGLLITSVCSTGCVIVTSSGDKTPQVERRRKPRGQNRPPTPPAKVNANSDKPRPAPAASPKPTLPRVTLPARQDPPRSRTKAHKLRDGIGEGRPAGFTMGADPAFWIWQGPRGAWRVRTTTKSEQHLFQGHVQGVTGTLVRVRHARNELRDHIWGKGRGRSFSFRTNGHADGFIFSTDDNGCARFDLLLDGAPKPSQIFIGRGQVNPSSGHFILCPRGRNL